MKKPEIKVGPSAGHCFLGQADLQVVYHVVRGDGNRGFMFRRKRLIDRRAFDYDPRLGWEVDIWFEWFPANVAPWESNARAT